jgi:hypothetical protein
VVHWSGPEGSETPASFTAVRPAESPATGTGGRSLAVAALAVSLLALGLAIRRGTTA